MIPVNMSDEEMKRLEEACGIKMHPGYPTPFTRYEVDGAMKNGSRVVKVRHYDGDAHEAGEKGTVLGSIDLRPANMPNGIQYAYFIEWDDRPGLAVMCTDFKLAPETTSKTH